MTWSDKTSLHRWNKSRVVDNIVFYMQTYQLRDKKYDYKIKQVIRDEDIKEPIAERINSHNFIVVTIK